MSEDDPLRRLEALLDKVHFEVVSGNLTGLAILAEDMDRLVGQLAAGRVRRSPVLVEQKAKRNAACLAAAARGLRSARRQLLDIAAAAAGGNVYDGSGNTRRMSASTERTISRA